MIKGTATAAGAGAAAIVTIILLIIDVCNTNSNRVKQIELNEINEATHHTQSKHTDAHTEFIVCIHHIPSAMQSVRNGNDNSNKANEY